MKGMYKNSWGEPLKKKILFLLFMFVCLTTSCFTQVVAPKSFAKPDIKQHEPVVFTLSDIETGDCTMSHFTVTFSPNGVCTLAGITWANQTHTGDVFKFDLITTDTKGNKILSSPMFAWPDHINDNGTHYPYLRTFNFNPETLPLIASVAIQSY